MKLFMELFFSVTLTGTVPFCVYLLLRRWLSARTTALLQYRLLKFCVLCFLFPFALVKSLILFTLNPRSTIVFDEYLYPQNTILKTSAGFELNPRGGFYQIFLPIWGALLLLIIGFHLFRYLRFRRQLSGRLTLPSEPQQTEFAFQKAAMGIRRPVSLLYYDAPVSPFTCGILRPCVVLTPIVSPDMVSMVIRHELQHIRSWDFFFRAAAFLVLLLHCFNPFSYLFWREFRAVQEEACDEKITSGLSPEQIRGYGHALVELSLSIQKKSFYSAALAPKKHRQIQRRIVRLGIRSHKKNVGAGICLAAACLIGFCVPVYACSPEITYWGSDSMTENSADADWVYVSLGEPEVEFPEDEIHFQYTDEYFLLEDGTVIYGPFQTDASQGSRNICAHTWEKGSYKDHQLNSSGGCTVTIYSGLVCPKCHTIKNLETSYEITYTPCPHI